MDFLPNRKWRSTDTISDRNLPVQSPSLLGDPKFCQSHGTRYAYHAGAMANGIASEQLVIALDNKEF